MDPLFVLQKIFREVFDEDDMVVTPQTSRDDVEGWDSVAQVKLVLTVETEFNLQFNEDEVSTMRNVGDFIKAIQFHKGNG